MIQTQIDVSFFFLNHDADIAVVIITTTKKSWIRMIRDAILCCNDYIRTSLHVTKKKAFCSIVYNYIFRINRLI